MRLLTFVDPSSGTLHVGALTRDGQRVIDLTVVGLDDMFMAVERAANLARLADHLVEHDGAAGYATADVRIVAPMPGARAVHAGLPGAASATRALPIAGAPPPLAFNDPAPLLGPADVLTVRPGDRWALAVAAVLGTGGRNVPEEHALALVAGYAIAGRWLGEADADTPVVQLGPWLVTPADAGDAGTSLPARVLVDDVVVAQGAWTVAEPFARLVSEASARYELRAGDVLTVLLPAAGGGPCAATLAAGQRVRLEVERLGALPAHAI